MNFCVGSAGKGLKNVQGLAFLVGRPGRLDSVRSLRYTTTQSVQNIHVNYFRSIIG